MFILSLYPSPVFVLLAAVIVIDVALIFVIVFVFIILLLITISPNKDRIASTNLFPRPKDNDVVELRFELFRVIK